MQLGMCMSIWHCLLGWACCSGILKLRHRISWIRGIILSICYILATNHSARDLVLTDLIGGVLPRWILFLLCVALKTRSLSKNEIISLPERYTEQSREHWKTKRSSLQVLKIVVFLSFCSSGQLRQAVHSVIGRAALLSSSPRS